MSQIKTEIEAVKKYRLLKVVKTTAPEGVSGNNWYTYVIDQSMASAQTNSTITGNRAGTLKQVTKYANQFVDELNFRNSNSGYSIWSPRQKK